MGARTNMNRAGDCGARTRTLIARYYLDLMRESKEGGHRLFLSMDGGDIFHNAITLILQDSRFRSLDSDSTIMERIRKRIRNVISEVKQDHAQLRNKIYADNIQASESEER